MYTVCSAFRGGLVAMQQPKACLLVFFFGNNGNSGREKNFDMLCIFYLFAFVIYVDEVKYLHVSGSVPGSGVVVWFDLVMQRKL
jgi:hypothetical protein